MKSKILIALLGLIFILSGTSVKSQIDPLKGVMDAVGAPAGVNELLGQFIGGIKPSAFTSGKTGKSDILKMLSGVDATDYLKYASVAGDLAGSLKETAFLPDWANKKDGVLDQLTKASSIADVAGGVLGLSSFINPSSFSKGFKKNKSSWTDALNLLSLVK